MDFKEKFNIGILMPCFGAKADFSPWLPILNTHGSSLCSALGFCSCRARP